MTATRIDKPRRTGSYVAAAWPCIRPTPLRTRAADVGDTVSALLASGVRRSLAQIRYVSPVLPGEASGLVARVYDQAERDFGLVAPPLVLHSPAPQALAAAWLMLRETLLATGSAAREQKEVVAAAVSVANECPYCVAVHSSAVRGLIGGSVPAELAAGRFEEIADPALRDIATWAASAGLPRRPAPAPVPAGSFPELGGGGCHLPLPEPHGQHLPPRVAVAAPDAKAHGRLGDGHARLGHARARARPRRLA